MAFKSVSDLEETLRVGTVSPEDMVIEPQPATGLKGGDKPRDLTAVEVAQLRADLKFSVYTQVSDVESSQVFGAQSDGVESDMTPDQQLKAASLEHGVSSQGADGSQNDPVSTADALSTERGQVAKVDTSAEAAAESVAKDSASEQETV